MSQHRDINQFMAAYGFQSILPPSVSGLFMEGISDTLISQIMRMKLQHVFSNTMIFTLKNSVSSHPKSELLRQNWESQLNLIMRFMWCCGFGACINKSEVRRLRIIQSIINKTNDLGEMWKMVKKAYPKVEVNESEFISDMNFTTEWATVGAEPDNGMWDDEYEEDDEGMVSAVDIAECLVYSKKDWIGTTKYAYWIPMMNTNSRMIYVRMRNVFTLRDDDCRVPGGEIVSRISRLIEDLELERKSRKCYETSMSSRSAPSVPFETVEKHRGLQISEEYQNSASSDRTDAKPREVRGDFEREVDGIEVHQTTKRILMPYRKEKDPRVPAQYYNVPDGMKIGKQTDAQDPTFFIETLHMRRSRIYAAFDIPESVVGLYSLQESKDFSTVGGLGGKTLSIGSLPWKLFTDANDRLAQELTTFMNLVMGYSKIRPVIHKMADKLSDDDDVSKVEDFDIDASVLQVMMPKTPSLDQVMSLISSGIMKYTSGVEIIAKIMSIDPSCFNMKEPPNLEQLVGIKPPEKGTKPPKKKQKTKK